MKKVVALLLILCMSFSLIACSNGTTKETVTGTTETGATDEPEVTTEPEATTEAGVAAAEDVILIGCLQDITGKTATLGKMIQAGAQYAIDEINSEGGLNGKMIQLITRDTTGDVTEAISAYELLCTQDGVSAIIGPPVANIGLAIAPLSEQYNVPLLGFATDTATLHDATGKTYKNMFLFQPSADQQSAIMGSYATEQLGASKIGVIYRNDNAYSVSLVDGFEKYLEGKDAEIVQTVEYTATDTDYSTMLMKIMNAGVDIIYAPNYTTELIAIVQQARAIGYEGKLICGLDAAPPFSSLTGEDADGVVYINNITESDENIAKIMEVYKSVTKTDATNKFFIGYDVMRVLAKIIGEVGTDPVAIRDATEVISGYEGLTGTFNMSPETHQLIGLEMYIHEIVNGESKMIMKYSAE